VKPPDDAEVAAGSVRASRAARRSPGRFAIIVGPVVVRSRLRSAVLGALPVAGFWIATRWIPSRWSWSRAAVWRAGGLKFARGRPLRRAVDMFDVTNRVAERARHAAANRNSTGSPIRCRDPAAGCGARTASPRLRLSSLRVFGSCIISGWVKNRCSMCRNTRDIRAWDLGSRARAASLPERYIAGEVLYGECDSKNRGALARFAPWSHLAAQSPIVGSIPDWCSTNTRTSCSGDRGRDRCGESLTPQTNLGCRRRSSRARRDSSARAEASPA
jgi:hypothetical protein